MPRKAPTPQTPEFLARVYRDMTPDVWRRLRAYAEKQSAKLHQLEGIHDPDYAANVASDAFVDTIDGVRTWDPSRRHLFSHLCGVVQSRIAHRVQHVTRFRHVAFHEPDDGDDNTSAVSLIETEMSLRLDDHRKRPDGAVTNAELRAKVYAAARELAAKDVEILAMLDAHESGALSEPEIIEHLGWTREHYFNVWRRFDRMRHKLPAELRDAALDVLTRGPIAASLEDDGE
jgi:hypothetical protein